MLSSLYRFRGHRAIARLYGKNVKVVRLPDLQIRYMPKSGKNYKCSVVVSKKTAKHAVTRNRIRRRIYEWARNNLADDFPSDIMISVFNEDFAKMPYDSLSQKLQTAISKTTTGKNKV